jgi:hypothetical protein
MFRAFQPGAFQQAVEVIAEQVGEPSLRIGADAPDPPAAFIERAGKLSPTKRKAVMVALLSLTMETLREAETLPTSGAGREAVQVAIYALLLYTLLLAMQLPSDKEK